MVPPPVTVVLAGDIPEIFPEPEAVITLLFPFATVIEKVFGLAFLAKLKLDGAVIEQGMGVGVDVGVGVGYGVGVGIGVGVGVRVGVGIGVAVGIGRGVGVGVDVGVGVGVTLGDGVGVAVGLLFGELPADGEATAAGTSEFRVTSPMALS